MATELSLEQRQEIARRAILRKRAEIESLHLHRIAAVQGISVLSPDDTYEIWDLIFSPNLQLTWAAEPEEELSS